MSSSAEGNWGWQDYWREQRVAACMPDNPASAAAIEAHWRALFSTLSEGSRVLDLATGNGVLLLWAAQSGRRLARTGVDLADIDPTRFLGEQAPLLADAQFLGKTSIEALPFAEASFDVVVSQYGLEYADLGRALAEAARVLAPGGRLYCLLHSGDSAVVQHGGARLAEIDLLLARNGPFAAMTAYTEARQTGRKLQRAIRELTEALKRAQDHAAAHPPAPTINQLCGAILEMANGWERFRPPDVEHWLSENGRRLRGQRQRLRDLHNAALDPTRRELLEQIVSGAPWEDVTLRALQVGDAETPVGLWLSAVRA